MKQQIKQVLLSTPFEKRLTTAQIIRLLKVPVAGSTVTSYCLELIKEKEINLCHVFEVGKWRYLRSLNLRVINKHNGHLSKLQKNKEDVKV
jgi:hypothetical protein